MKVSSLTGIALKLTGHPLHFYLRSGTVGSSGARLSVIKSFF